MVKEVEGAVRGVGQQGKSSQGVVVQVGFAGGRSPPPCRPSAAEDEDTSLRLTSPADIGRNVPKSLQGEVSRSRTRMYPNFEICGRSSRR